MLIAYREKINFILALCVIEVKFFNEKQSSAVLKNILFLK